MPWPVIWKNIYIYIFVNPIKVSNSTWLGVICWHKNWNEKPCLNESYIVPKLDGFKKFGKWLLNGTTPRDGFALWQYVDLISPTLPQTVQA